MCDVRASSFEQNPPDAVQVLKQVVAYRDRSLDRHFRCDGVANDMAETRKLNWRLRSANAAFTLESFGLGWTQALHCPARWFCTRSMSIIATAASSWLCWREVCGLNIYTSRRRHDKSITSFLSLPPLAEQTVLHPCSCLLFCFGLLDRRSRRTRNRLMRNRFHSPPCLPLPARSTPSFLRPSFSDRWNSTTPYKDRVQGHPWQVEARCDRRLNA